MKIIEGFFLGLSTGTSCIMACYPIFLPYLCSSIEGIKENNKKFLFFIIGRFISYILVGIIIGLSGYYALKYIPPEFEIYLRRVSYIVVGFLLILNGINFEFPKNHFCQKTLFLKDKKISAFSLGFLAGLNLCPPFIAAASRVFGLESNSAFSAIISGGFYFLFFFIGTTIFLLPLSLIGFFNKIKNKDFLNLFQFISRWTMIILGIYFSILEGLLYFLSR
ncbi:MAG TPA: sulfite exporter TauE/SafE family protein [Exilispira sp.]|nr:sulfite exporter TauE/SafE family protein [Exilispira sp.]